MIARQKNGFRCALYADQGAIPEKALQPVEIAAPEVGRPVPDAVFQAYKGQFSYDKKDLNAKIEWRKESSPEWVQEKVTVDAAYVFR